MQTRQLTLADGRVVAVTPGDLLPDGLPDDFVFFFVPGDVIDATKGANVFVGNTMKNCREGVGLYEGKTDDRTNQYVYARANECIVEFMPRHAAVYARRAGGDTKAKKEWRHFCDCCAIVLAYRLALGETLRVLLDPPELPQVASQCYMLRAPGAPR